MCDFYDVCKGKAIPNILIYHQKYHVGTIIIKKKKTTNQIDQTLFVKKKRRLQSE